MSEDALSVIRQVEHLIDQGQLEVPLLPEVAGKVVQLVNDPDSDAAQLATLMQSDQALAGHVMRIANSAAYSPNASIVSLQQAISRLGMGMMGEIALAASVNTKMFSTPGYEPYVETIWRHALASALWAKEVARIGRRNVEAAFLCGLLHSIGRPVVIQALLEAAQSHGLTLEQTALHQAEQRLAKEATAAVLAAWDMPRIVQEAIRYADDYSDAGAATEQAMLVQAGSLFARLTTGQIDADTLTGDAPVLADLNLYDDEIQTLLDKADAVNATLEAMRT